MKLIHDNIVMVEDGDDAEKAATWLIDNTDIELRGYQNDSWLHDLKYGDIIVMNSPIPNNARFTLNVNVLTKPVEDSGARSGWTDFHDSLKDPIQPQPFNINLIANIKTESEQKSDKTE